MSPIRKGAKAPSFFGFALAPDLKDGVSNSLYLMIFL
jgi:hypothetical protein